MPDDEPVPKTPSGIDTCVFRQQPTLSRRRIAMTLRQKTLLIVGLAISLFSLTLVFFANTILLGGFSQVERTEAEANISRASNAVSAEIDSLDTFLADWTVWDDSYQFAAAPDSEYIKKNLTAATFGSQHIDLLVVLDSAKRLVYSSAYDSAAKAFRPIPREMLNHLQPASPLLRHTAPDSVVHGLVLLPEAPLLVSSRPILDSEKQLPARGFMIAGRFLTPDTLKKIAANTQLSLQLKISPDPSLQVDFAYDAQNSPPVLSRWITEADSTTLLGNALLEDLNHKPALLLQVHMPRTIYTQGRKTIQYFLCLLVAFGVLFCAIHLLLLEKTILARLARLSKQVYVVSSQSSPQIRVNISGRDELASLADSINDMLRSLSVTQSELQESETTTRALLEGMPDTLLRVDRAGIILDFKAPRDRTTATPAKLFVGNSLSTVFPAELAAKLSEDLALVFKTKSAHIFEHEMTLNNKESHQEIRINRIHDNEALIILRDFTERRKLEKSLEFFNLRDNLTGVFNRIYWEEKLAAADRMEGVSAGVILCDIDGMRLINESLGRDRGNRLLIAMATALRSSLPLDATLARIGNDEFAALLIGYTAANLEIFCQKILQEIARSSLDDASLRFSISFGHAIGTLGEQKVREIVQTAEINLHRDKLSRSQTSRGEIFKNLQIALASRDFVSHQHAARLWALGRPLAIAAGLPNRRMRNLKLLTQYHDIGKVGLSDDLIFNEDLLSDDEMQQMRQHVEIGHHTAQSIPELFAIADLILRHHEWWNGQGYPLGLKEDEIPLECRIFAIIDAYDAMTNDRPDRKAASGKKAAAELRKYAGSQFDPELVEKFIDIIDGE